MGLARWVMPVGLAALAAGCISVETLIRVRADGSGTVIETVTMNPAALETAIAATNPAAKDPLGANVGLGPLDDVARAKARAATMGEGVTFVSADPIDTKTARGLSVVYAFRDIGKLAVSQRPDARLGLPANQADQQICFAFSANPSGASVLTVRMRNPLPSPRPPTSPGATPRPETNPASLAMARQIFQGMRLRVAVEVEGKITGTSSPFVDGATVTLLDIDFEALLGDESKLNELRAASRGGSIEDLHRVLRGVPGIKISLDPEVRIEFAAK